MAEAPEGQIEMIKLTMWEQFGIITALSFLTMLGNQITNQTELAALQSTIGFLQKLLAGQVPAA